jgi:hypothetical protein
VHLELDICVVAPDDAKFAVVADQLVVRYLEFTGQVVNDFDASVSAEADADAVLFRDPVGVVWDVAGEDEDRILVVVILIAPVLLEEARTRSGRSVSIISIVS